MKDFPVIDCTSEYSERMRQNASDCPTLLSLLESADSQELTQAWHELERRWEAATRTRASNGGKVSSPQRMAHQQALQQWEETARAWCAAILTGGFAEEYEALYRRRDLRQSQLRAWERHRNVGKSALVAPNA